MLSKNNFILLITLFVLMHQITACGVTGNITGGKKDTIPPQLVSVNIPFKATNINLDINKIQFNFNEFIQVKNNPDISINPSFKTPLNIFFNRKKVQIRLDSIKPQTTYLVKLNKAVSDFNEGNESKNITWLFSTGNHIDTFSIKGRVISALTNLPDTTINVILYATINDSIATYQKPDYITKTNSKGDFIFEYLKPQPYLLFALEDVEKNNFYTNPSLRFAFQHKPIHPQNLDSLYLLRVFNEKKTEIKKTNIKIKKGKNILEFYPDLKGNDIDFDKPLHLSYNVSLKQYIKESIILCDTGFYECENIDSSLHIDTLKKIITLNYNWLPDTQYKLVISTKILPDTSKSVMLKNDTLLIKTLPHTEYGKVIFVWKDTPLIKKPLLRILSPDANQEFGKTTLKKDSTNFIPLLKKGKYKIDIVDDTNQNDKFDLGDYKKKTQPEHLYFVQNELEIEGGKIIVFNIELQNNEDL